MSVVKQNLISNKFIRVKFLLSRDKEVSSLSLFNPLAKD